MQVHAGISVSFPVLITSVKKYFGNSAGMYLSQLTHCFEYVYLTSSIQDSFESAVFYQSWKNVSGTIHNFLIKLFKCILMVCENNRLCKLCTRWYTMHFVALPLY